MRTLSIGLDSTLGNWAKLCALAFGPESKSVAFFKQKIAESPHGEHEEVIADESQLMLVVLDMESGATDSHAVGAE